jgi:flagellar L-ring protein precursor FlgH
MPGVVEVRELLTAQPVVATIPPSANGAIFQTASYQPLFEDRRARRVGDTLTININEKLNASKSAHDGEPHR